MKRITALLLLFAATAVVALACLSTVALADDQAAIYFDAAEVGAAFDKGAVLFDGGGANYMVHASRREGAGRCEVHRRDTDIIYMLEGTATFVTGGTCVDPRPTAADEIRGTSVQGGDVRQLRKGDVVIVPHDTPHWFKEVDGPVLYYVVKVR